jgi:CubicO group peptidase (beta-lactamase class C family)
MTKLCLIFLHYFQAPKEPYKLHGGRYAYLTSSWLFSEIVRGVTGESVDQFIMNHFVDRLGLKNEFFLCLPKCCVEASLNEKGSFSSKS